ncbi:hypothetical protein J2T55_001375 [Methylohalomonas lacus]|uniref:Outer membrane protein assembly factor BamE n=1 Tax=Methylohalomonas lacus TaxID=398773 RepID=A0AAE3L111_9GAMM|nr:hypothetical protein [Methylohalomonas lacus]MCS3903354.1 hypothetical protein [Methylohalomonas lacus]
MKLLSLLPLVVLLLVAGCESKLEQDNFRRIETDMSEAEVFAILGEPDETSSLQFGDLSGTSAVWKDDNTRITIQFVNDAVKFKQYTRSEADRIIE